MDIEPLNATEEEVWRALVRLMVVLPRALDEDLQHGAGLSMTHYVVLMSLSEVPDRQLRMSDLASRASLSPSRMSRIIHLLQERGLVIRTASSDDGRAGIATLTDAGLQALQAAWPTHLDSARTIIFDQVEPAQLPAIATTMSRILTAARQPAAMRQPAAGRRPVAPNGR